jgi:hypothetical protein
MVSNEWMRRRAIWIQKNAGRGEAIASLAYKKTAVALCHRRLG